MPCGMPQPQIDVLDRRRVDTRVALEQLVDDEGARLVRAELGQRALEGAPDGRADGVDDHCFGHCESPVGDGRRTRKRYRGAIRSAPSSRIVSPFSIWFSAMWQARRGVLVGLAEPRREGDLLRRAPRAPPRAARPAAACRTGPARSCRRGCRCARQVARGRQRQADDAALRRRVGGLADLAVEGGDRGGHHHGAALAVGVRLAGGHRRGAQAQHVEGADQVHAHDGLERLQLGRPVACPRCARPSRCPRTRRPGAARRAPRPRRRPRPRPRLVGHVGLERQARRRARPASASARSSSQVDDGHARAARGQLACGGRAEAGGAAGDECADAVQLHRRGRYREAPRRRAPRDATAARSRPPSSVRKSSSRRPAGASSRVDGARA